MWAHRSHGIGDIKNDVQSDDIDEVLQILLR